MLLGSYRQKSEVTQNMWIWPSGAFKKKRGFIRSKQEFLLEVAKWLSWPLKRLPREEAYKEQRNQPEGSSVSNHVPQELKDVWGRKPLLIKPLPLSECEANKAAPFQGTSTPNQPVCLFIARMEIINASWHWGHSWGQSPSPFCKTRGNELPSTCGSGLVGRGDSRHPTPPLWERSAPQAVGSPTQSLPPRLGPWESACGKGKREALVWAGPTPTEAIPNDRRTLIPWRRAGVVSGSCSCSSTGARLRPQVAGRRRPTATWARAADSAPPPRFHRSDWVPYPAGVQDGGRGRGSWPSGAAIGEARAFGPERRPQ